MIRERRDKWCAALRSKKYPQGRKVLRTLSGEYCCLGVFCDITDSSKWILSKKTSLWHYDSEVANTGMPPLEICEEIGSKETTILTRLNDCGMEFPDIACWIEKNIVVTD